MTPCHVYMDARPLDVIALYRAPFTLDGALGSINVRYCVDRERCVTGAPVVATRWRARHGAATGPRAGA
jgi:hypothetical protein